MNTTVASSAPPTKVLKGKLLIYFQFKQLCPAKGMDRLCDQIAVQFFKILGKNIKYNLF